MQSGVARAAQRKEDAEVVWRAALGALLHLTAAAGRPIGAWAAALPPAACAKLLRSAERYRWCAASGCARSDSPSSHTLRLVLDGCRTVGRRCQLRVCGRRADLVLEGGLQGVPAPGTGHLRHSAAATVSCGRCAALLLEGGRGGLPAARLGT